MSSRPPTSKPRGVCKYYGTPRGCFAGSSCKFLHGEDEKLTRYDQAKVCKFYAAGYCRRGAECWFLHSDPSTSKPVGDTNQALAASEEDDYVCSICLEKPVTFGLLVNCDHVFCLQCIRQWRNSGGPWSDVDVSNVNKCCPLCRIPSQFVTPSSRFYPSSLPGKAATIEQYKASMARVPCRYFQASLRRSHRFCPFGKDCFYQHKNEDGTDYVFEEGRQHYMRLHPQPSIRIPRTGFTFTRDGDQDAPWIEQLGATLEAIRVSLPAFLQRVEEDENEDEDLNPDGDDGSEPPPAELLQQLPSISFEALLHEALDYFETEDRTRDNPLDHFGTTSPTLTGRRRIVYSDPGSPADIPDPFDFLSLAANEDDDPPSLPTPSTPTDRRTPVEGSSRFSTVVTHQEYDARFTTADGTPLDESTPSEIVNESPDDLPDASGNIDGAGTYPLTTVAQECVDESRHTSPLPTSQPSQDECNARSASQLPDPPVLTDGRGRVVWSTMSAARNRRRADASASQGKPSLGSTSPSAI